MPRPPRVVTAEPRRSKMRGERMREPTYPTVSAFTADLAAGRPVPAGGSASALTGSVAAALMAMVCRVSLGRDDVVAKDEELREALEQSERLRCRLLELVAEDALAFEAITDAMAMPEDDDDQRAARGEALMRAMWHATAPALETLAAAQEALALAASLAGRASPEAASDLGVAVQLALTSTALAAGSGPESRPLALSPPQPRRLPLTRMHCRSKRQEAHRPLPMADRPRERAG